MKTETKKEVYSKDTDREFLKRLTMALDDSSDKLNVQYLCSSPKIKLKQKCLQPSNLSELVSNNEAV